MRRDRTAEYKPWLYTFLWISLVWITFLLFAGGVTTSINAGMAFLDWPLSNSSINPEGWTRDAHMRAEHSHRLLGMVLGVLSIAIAIWAHLREERRWVRVLGWTLAALVPFQGLLGGLRVLFDPLATDTEATRSVAQTFRVLHAVTAMITLCLLVAITVSQSRRWIERGDGLVRRTPRSVRWGGIVSCVIVFITILLGAIMRHHEWGHMILTFPYSTPKGEWLPQFWSVPVAVHFSHRVGALLTTIAIVYFVSAIYSHHSSRRSMCGMALLLFVVLNLQIFLGVTVIASIINADAATMHHLVGGLLLALCFALTFLAHRPPRPDLQAAEAPSQAVPQE